MKLITSSTQSNQIKNINAIKILSHHQHNTTNHHHKKLRNHLNTIQPNQPHQLNLNVITIKSSQYNNIIHINTTNMINHQITSKMIYQQKHNKHAIIIAISHQQSTQSHYHHHHNTIKSFTSIQQRCNDYCDVNSIKSLSDHF
jgi:hypothetical protein